MHWKTVIVGARVTPRDQEAAYFGGVGSDTW